LKGLQQGPDRRTLALRRTGWSCWSRLACAQGRCAQTLVPFVPVGEWRWP